jgi:hypothetical protein
MVLLLVLGKMMFSPRHLKTLSIEVEFEDGVSSSTGWQKGFSEEYVGMHKKKKRSSNVNKEEIVGETDM